MSSPIADQAVQRTRYTLPSIKQEPIKDILAGTL